MNSFGRIFRVTIFGESHGEGVGVVIDGCPAGLPLTLDDFLPDLERRKGGTQKGTTPRQEEDLPIFKSGLFKDKATGAPITILFENKNIRSADYEKQRDFPRPGHADFVANKKFGGNEDYRGSGHFSGRLTVALVAAGVVAKKILDLTPDPSPKERGALTDSESSSYQEKKKPGYYTSTIEEWKFLNEYAKENRRKNTQAEYILWQELRNRKVNGFKFRRQHAVHGYIPDFVCLSKKLIVEVDGGYHLGEQQSKLDKERTDWLNQNDFKILRFTNEQVIKQLSWVLEELRSSLGSPNLAEEEEALSFGEGLGEVGITISSSILEIGGEKDLEKGLQRAIDAKDSIGGIIECRVSGLPVGLGEPFFDSVESLISHIVFAIPAVRAIEFGTGFAAAKMFGSEHNDAIVNDEGKTRTNHAGGVVGGLTNGNEFVFRIVIKPTSSTPKEQNSLNWETGNVENFSVKGRHDLCIALRVPVVLEAVTAIVLADLMLLEQRITRIIDY